MSYHHLGASAEAETGSRASMEPASGLHPSGFDPARWSVWPFGKGVVACAAGLDATAGHLYVFAVPDRMLVDDWRNGRQLNPAELLAAGGRVCVLAFSDAPAVDRFALHLDEVKSALAAREQ